MVEDRKPRASFTRKLERICLALDESSSRTVPHKHFYDGPQVSKVEITSLWVVGSYARGALTCGDLDLVYSKVLVEGPAVDSAPVARAFFGSIPLVRYYAGTPDTNASGVSFPEAVQIWSGSGCDWGGAIASILPDPLAGRASRSTDAVPLRTEQLRIYGSELLTAADMEKDGLLEWEFVGIDNEMLAVMSKEEIEDGEQLLARSMEVAGKKSRQLMPAMLRLMRKLEVNGSWEEDGLRSTVYRCGGTDVHIGRPALPLSDFNDEPSLRQMALIPHISARGPNGAWLIRRGLKHPDIIELATRCAFYLGRTNDPDIVYYEYGYREIRGLELFTSVRLAEQNAAKWALAGEQPAQIHMATGKELLNLFGLVEVLEIDAQTFPLTRQAAYFFETERVSLQSVLQALPDFESATVEATT